MGKGGPTCIQESLLIALITGGGDRTRVSFMKDEFFPHSSSPDMSIVAWSKAGVSIS